MTRQLESILQALPQLTQDERSEILSYLNPKPQNKLEKLFDGIIDWQNELKLRGYTEGTVDLYSRTIKRYLSQDANPTPNSVRAILAERLKLVTPTKVRNDQKALKSFFDFLEHNELWLDNPVKDMKLIKVKKVIRRSPREEDVLRLLNAWDYSSPRKANKRLKHKVLIMLLIDTGLRISEACSATFSSI